MSGWCLVLNNTHVTFLSAKWPSQKQPTSRRSSAVLRRQLKAPLPVEGNRPYVQWVHLKPNGRHSASRRQLNRGGHESRGQSAPFPLRCYPKRGDKTCFARPTVGIDGQQPDVSPGGTPYEYLGPFSELSRIGRQVYSVSESWDVPVLKAAQQCQKPRRTFRPWRKLRKTERGCQTHAPTPGSSAKAVS